MHKNLKRLLSIGLISTLLIASGIPVHASKSENALDRAKETETTQSAKKVVVYFPNWGIYGAPHQFFEVGHIPWDKVTHINHSFFSIGNDLKLTSIDTFADYDKSFAHSEGWDVPNRLAGHFGEYKYYKNKYPNVKVLVSVGGWTRGENFHKMALTPQSRKIFITSVVDFLKKYPFIDGIDLDWEYPGIDRPKDPNDQYDKGCPGGPEDKENFTALLKEIREAYNSNGLSGKLLTIAASAGYEKLQLQEPDKYHHYLDFINVMTYDMHGAWERKTNSHAALYANPNDPSGTTPVNIKERYNTDSAMKELVNTYHIPPSKLNVGSPFYSRGWGGVKANSVEEALFADAPKYYHGSWDDPANPTPGGQEAYYKIKELEKTAGWEKGRDPYGKTPYLYNKSKEVFLTYEDEESLAARCNYVNDNQYGGIIVWEITGDIKAQNFPMLTLIYNAMKNPVPDPLPAVPNLRLKSQPVKGSFDLEATLIENHKTTSLELTENTKLIETKAVDSNTKNVLFAIKDRVPGTYVYQVHAKNAQGQKVSTAIEVVVPDENPNLLPLTPCLCLKTQPVNGSFDLEAILSNDHNTTSIALLENGTVIENRAVNASIHNVLFKMNGKVPGNYIYQVRAMNAQGQKMSSELNVVVSNDNPELKTASVQLISQDGQKNYKIGIAIPAFSAAKEYVLKENGLEIDKGIVDPKNPSAMGFEKVFSNKADGTYNYTCELKSETQKTVSPVLKVTVNTSTNPDYPAWAPGVSYKAGNRVIYEGKVYECLQPHTSITTWEPTATPALWKYIK